MTDLLVSGVLALVADQWSKRMASSCFADRRAAWGRFLRIRRVQNSRELHRSAKAQVALLLVWLAALVAVLVLYREDARFRTHSALIGLGSACGGAAGNLLDICRRRPIIDFIDLGWWPAFNAADVAIVGGIVLAFWPRN